MQHSVRAFDDDLSALRSMIEEMGRLTREALDAAITALSSDDESLAARVVQGDREIDRLEQQIDQFAIRTIALRAPMADDLRDIVSALKIANNLERAADYAKNIARRSRKMHDKDAARVKARLATLAERSGALIDLAVEAYAHRDSERAIAVCKGDDAVDDLYAEIFRDTVKYMRSEPDEVGWATHALFIAKHLERMGDQATNVAEIVYYAATGDMFPDRAKVEPDES